MRKNRHSAFRLLALLLALALVVSCTGCKMKLGKEETSEPEEEPDPEALAEQVISSNFKVGLSQEEVDALLNGMN